MIVALNNEGAIPNVHEFWEDNGELVVIKDWDDEGVLKEKRFEMQDWKVQRGGP